MSFVLVIINLFFLCSITSDGLCGISDYIIFITSLIGLLFAIASIIISIIEK